MPGLFSDCYSASQIRIKPISLIAIVSILLLLVVTAVSAQSSGQKRSIGRYVYRCANGGELKVDLYQHRRTGFHQVIIGFREGTVIALDQSVTPPPLSGLRFSDDVNHSFWMRGNQASVEVLDRSGRWVTQYQNCQYQ